MEVKVFNELCDDAKNIRAEVFIKEQGFENEFDDIDSKATHIVAYEKEPVAVCRVFFSDKRKCYIIGRIAVKKECRGKNYGALIVKSAEEYIKKIGGTKVGLSAQKRVVNFYEKSRYKMTGEEYLDEGCPHVFMEKILN